MYLFELNEIQEQIKDTARKFAQEEIAPTAIERDIKGEYPAEIIRKLGDLGFLGMMVSPDWGGSGLDTISYVLAMEEICKVDASGIMTIAERKDGGWLLNGTKNWISTGLNSNYYIIFAQTNPELKHKGIAAFVVEKGTEGFVPGAKEDKLGVRSSDTTSLGMTNVFLTDDNLIGNVGQGFYIAMHGLNGGRIGIAAQSVGIAQGAFEASVKYALQRKTMGKLICEHQAIQFKIAQMSMRIDAARLLVHKAADLRDKGLDHIRASSEAKLFASTTAFDVAREAIQIHGGYGYVREYQVERMLRDAKVTEIYEGTSEIHHIVIAREVLKQYEGMV